MGYNIPGNAEQNYCCLAHILHRANCRVAFLILLHLLSLHSLTAQFRFPLFLCLSRIVPQTKCTLQSRDKKFREIYAIGKMQIVVTKGQSIVQRLAKKCGCTDWFVNGIDTDTAKTILLFFNFKTQIVMYRKINFTQLDVSRNRRVCV